MKKIKSYNPTISKKEKIEIMFNNIANNYDFLNNLLSIRMHKLWKQELIKNIKINNAQYILDVATGTGDLLFEHAKHTTSKIIGCDISKNMLEIAKIKVRKMHLDHRIHLIYADVECLPFSENTFDIITISFGIRNFENLKKSLSEILRVLKKNGELHILEFSQPINLLTPIFKLYIYSILPKIGNFLSKDLTAYSYLSKSIKLFPYGEKIKIILQNIGFNNIKYKKLTFGIVTLYKAIK